MRKERMRLSVRKLARVIWITLMLIVIGGGMMSCEMESVPCQRCAQNYDRDGVFIGETCWSVPCCEVYYPYDCSNQI